MIMNINSIFSLPSDKNAYISIDHLRIDNHESFKNIVNHGREHGKITS